MLHLLKRPDSGHSTGLLRSKEGEGICCGPAGLEPTTSQVFATVARALPLCYDRCPALKKQTRVSKRGKETMIGRLAQVSLFRLHSTS